MILIYYLKHIGKERKEINLFFGNIKYAVKIKKYAISPKMYEISKKMHFKYH